MMIELIRDLFAVNRGLVFFVYGQIFFVLGLTTALQSWRHSRLVLARSLKWLAVFGITHGLHGWGDVFIPLQAQYMAPPFIDLLLGLQAMLLAVSFVALFQFGVEHLRPLPDQQRYLRYLPGAALVIWIFVAFGPSLTATDSGLTWYRLNNIWARYTIGFPAALLAAYGLRTQAYRLIAPVEMPHIWRTLQIAGLALASYSVMGGLIVPPANFFPASWLNSVVIEQVTLIPIPVYRSVVGLILMLALLRAFEVFRIELDRHLSTMEETQVLITERERIGRELHDGTLQTIYAAGLLLRTSEKELTQEAISASCLSRVEQSIALLDEAVRDIRSYIGALQTEPNSQSLAASLQELATSNHMRSLVDVEVDLNLPDDQPLTPAQVGHLLAIVNESLSNVVRHSHATHLHIAANIMDGQLILKIEDNGQGLPSDYVEGYGLRNMQDRARLLGGSMAVDTNQGIGTRVTVKLPWDEVGEDVTNLVS